MNFTMGDFKQKMRIQVGSPLLSVTHKHGFIALFIMYFHIVPIVPQKNWDFFEVYELLKHIVVYLFFFPQEYKKEIVYFALQCSCSKFTSLCEESLDEIKQVEKNFMECANERARNKSIYARLMLRV